MILRLSRSELDRCLLPATLGGQLEVRYNAGNGSTEYRTAGRLIATAVRGHYFAEV